MGLAEGGGFGFAEGAEFAGAALDDGTGNFVRKRGSFSAGTLRKRENVEIGEGARFNEGQRCSVVGFGFAGEARRDTSGASPLGCGRSQIAEACGSAGRCDRWKQRD